MWLILRLLEWKQPKKHKNFCCTKIAAWPAGTGAGSAASPMCARWQCPLGDHYSTPWPMKLACTGGAPNAHVAHGGAAYLGRANTRHSLLPHKWGHYSTPYARAIFYLDKMCKRCFWVKCTRTWDFYICHPRMKGWPPYVCGGRRLPPAMWAESRPLNDEPCVVCNNRLAHALMGIIPKTLPNFHNRAYLLVRTLSEDRFCYFV